MDRRMGTTRGMTTKSREIGIRGRLASPNLELSRSPSWPKVQQTNQTGHRHWLGSGQGKGGGHGY